MTPAAPPQGVTLRFDTKAQTLEGEYFTSPDRKTDGKIHFERVSTQMLRPKEVLAPPPVAAPPEESQA